MSASVYAICEDGGTSPVKIGWTKSPLARLPILQVGNPRRLQVRHERVLDSSELAKAIETRLHRKFRNQHVLGEWFAVDVADVIAAIDAAEATFDAPGAPAQGVAARIIAKFGTQSEIAKVLGINQSAVSRWAKTGFIPQWHWVAIVNAAAARGIEIVPEDFFEPQSEAA